MKVKWTVYHEAFELYPDEIPEPSNYEGEVIGVAKSFWNGTMLVVACSDGVVREVAKGRVTVIKEK